MSWLGHVPIHLPGLPSLSWAALIWLGLFLAAAPPVAGLAARAWHGYLTVTDAPDAEPERLFALGQAISRTCGAVMVACGLAVGFIAAAQPPVPEVRLTLGQTAYVLVFLVFGLAVLVQNVALEQSQRAAFAALRRRPQ